MIHRALGADPEDPAPNSSPSTESPDRSWAMRFRRASSTARSASVTGVRSGLVSTWRSVARNLGREIESARSASSRAKASSAFTHSEPSVCRRRARGSTKPKLMDITHPAIEGYIRGLLRRHDESVLLEMEAEAKERDFPIVGRMVGVVLELLARAIGAKRVIELGSGYGYSGYWFSRAVGPDGELHLTDGDPENERKALDYLGRAGLARPVQFHVGEAVAALGEAQGMFDIVYCDIDKDGYPGAWRAARDR